MEGNRELACNIIYKFEELLLKHNIKLPNDERTGDETESCIFGSEYYELEDTITNILDNRKYIVYQIEVGVLNRPEDEGQGYDDVWDKKHTYYNEDWGAYRTYEEAKEYIDYYVQKGVKNTYGIVSRLEVTEDEYYSVCDGSSEYIELEYDLDKVIYTSLKNKNNEIVYDFMNTNLEEQENYEEESR